MTMSLPESAILDALSSYRKRIGSHNHRAFSAIIPEIEATVPEDPDLFDSDEKLEQTRLQFSLRLIGNGENTHPQVTRPSDVLSHWEDLAPQVVLAGASVDHDAGWRDEMRDVYPRGVMRGLNERCPGIVPSRPCCHCEAFGQPGGPGLAQISRGAREREFSSRVGFVAVGPVTIRRISLRDWSGRLLRLSMRRWGLSRSMRLLEVGRAVRQETMQPATPCTAGRKTRARSELVVALRCFFGKIWHADIPGCG